MAVIEQVIAREILDSRGNPTVEVEVCLEDVLLQQLQFHLVPPQENLKL